MSPPSLGPTKEATALGSLSCRSSDAPTSRFGLSFASSWLVGFILSSADCSGRPTCDSCDWPEGIPHTELQVQIFTYLCVKYAHSVFRGNTKPSFQHCFKSACNCRDPDFITGCCTPKHVHSHGARMSDASSPACAGHPMMSVWPRAHRSPPCCLTQSPDRMLVLSS